MQPVHAKPLPQEALDRQAQADTLTLQPKDLPWRSNLNHQGLVQAIEVFEGQSNKFVYQISVLQGAMADPRVILVKFQTVNKTELADSSRLLAQQGAQRSFDVFALEVSQTEPAKEIENILDAIRNVAHADQAFEPNIPGLSIHSSERNDQVLRLFRKPLQSAGFIPGRALPRELGYAEWFAEIIQSQWS